MDNPTPSSTMLQLPDEILLQITFNLSESVKQPDPQRNLINLALTCKQLAPLAREALCHAPIVQSSKVLPLLRTLFAYPSLRSKARSLTIETKETRCEHTMPHPLPKLNSQTLRHCTLTIRSLPFVDEETKDWWIADLSACFLQFPGPLICLLISMLPRIEELYLGGSVLFNLPLFRAMLPALDHTSATSTVTNSHPQFEIRRRRVLFGERMSPVIRRISNWNLPNLSPITTTLLGPRLTHLELPNDMRLSPDDAPRHMEAIADIATTFPLLTFLSIPAGAVSHYRPDAIIPQLLQHLVLTDVQSIQQVGNWEDDLAMMKLGQAPPDHLRRRTSPAHPFFPKLSKLEICYRKRERPASASFYGLMAEAGIVYKEHIPECCFIGGREFWHPWLFAGEGELERAQGKRHDKYEARKTEAIKRNRIARERALERSVERGIMALRWLFREKSVVVCGGGRVRAGGEQEA
ncbi:hypothetical protein N0V83_002063 [Neocucurbitaria cava]|uniref:F-box domain-containing protein n=1 Tax=Neocucurbitaria cava TaxID=798079 RepID=A0A9W8YDT4_9PLEO|nr:hypothetical protein N0V83_002063 [Neocucurbitaria cava]